MPFSRPQCRKQIKSSHAAQIRRAHCMHRFPKFLSISTLPYLSAQPSRLNFSSPVLLVPAWQTHTHTHTHSYTMCNGCSSANVATLLPAMLLVVASDTCQLALYCIRSRHRDGVQQDRRAHPVAQFKPCCPNTRHMLQSQKPSYTALAMYSPSGAVTLRCLVQNPRATPTDR